MDNSNRAGANCDCVVGYFDNSGTCELCMKNCKSCTVGNKCISCPDGSNRAGDLCECSDGYF